MTRRLNYRGSTAWKTDLAADSTSSATEVRWRGGSSVTSARSSSGLVDDGISAGGVGRCGSSIGTETGLAGNKPAAGLDASVAGTDTVIGGGNGCAARDVAFGISDTRGASGMR